MWIMTTGGFVSAVEDRGDSTKVVVRARDRESLQTMINGIELIASHSGEIEVGKGTDYPYRVTVLKHDFALWVAYEASEFINYPNFKDAVKKSRGEKWSKALMRVWNAMIDITDDAAQHIGILAPFPLDYRTVGESKYGTAGGSYRKPKSKRKGKGRTNHDYPLETVPEHPLDRPDDPWSNAWTDMG